MLDEMRVNDEPLDISDIRQLENADEIAHFFAKLRYDVDIRRTIPLAATAYANTQDLKMHIRHHELIATDTADEDIRIYLFEVRSVTARLRNDLARGFLKTNDEKVLLVLTSEYEDIEFVYLERSDPQKTSRKGLSLKITIRPIPLTVNRRNPDPVALRVLKRFTFTEEDADYQWEKLRSAYMLAEWSEEYFNNRALFSDYYLKERLTDPRITPEWDEDVRPVGRDIYRHSISARKNYTRQTEDVIRRGLFEPAFELLGFDVAEKKSGSSSAEEADYLLYAPGDQSQPIAAALTYAWNRNLDDVDTTRDVETPDEIPGAMVVSLLEAQVAPWVIVTNGKLWRLYSSTASNKATNYYEIDLEEAIAANDQITALKYWWLMFRREAFTGFLDDLLKNSTDYAKELGDRLKDRVFVEIFPQFAKGFIADMRGQGIRDFDDETLAMVFSGTMTFLYRLMFILYAESLELLPINEVLGYREMSLYRIKQEIADAGGTVLDQSPDKLNKAYRANSYELYQRLGQLFTVIDLGSDELNMPTYNGGLFSQENDGGQFLASYGIPDRYLALGLDRLTRDIDQKTQALAFIDFKSLGVRQLGSIYEGLLEFKLRIASEALAVTREKGREVYQPAKKVKKPLATLAKGEVYLENDKQERKATGSYYTPDYIVKYIVRHTVGPVLDRKFDELIPRLRSAEKGYRDYAALVEARRRSSGKDESAAVYWNNPEMKNLVDDCLNVRVLDPAMGSGHFLVEVVDYVSNRLIDFLNGWSENPIWNFIDQTRQDILNDMERQHVSIDPDRLTRVALLKRAVLKRCVYGVDLNLMAVELAKVSLWLDAFTLGAPLSFLDHHLKHGNSLIGARVADVQQALEGQQTLFSQNKFAGVMLATDLMRQVSTLSDNTIEQKEQSEAAYRDARDHLAPYKRVLDVYTSRWFGNAPITGRRGSQGTDVTVEFLQRNDTQAWLEDPRKPENRLPADDYMQAGLVAKTALQAAEEKRFFHWELEFPEVFFAPSKPGGQDVQLRQEGGFDAVVGNPPYVRQEGLGEQKIFLEAAYQVFHSAADLYSYFIEQSTRLLRPRGNYGVIVANKWMRANYGLPLRTYLREKHISQIVDFGDLPVFPDAMTYPCIVVVGNEIPNTTFRAAEIPNLNFTSFDTFMQSALFEAIYPEDDEVGWSLIPAEISDVLRKLELNAISLDEYTGGKIFYGIKTGLNEAFVIDEITKNRLIAADSKSTELIKPFLAGREIDRYSPPQNDGYLILIPNGWTHQNKGKQEAWKWLKSNYPAIADYLEAYREAAEKRSDQGEYWWELRPCVYYDEFEKPKLVLPDIAARGQFAIDVNNAYVANTGYIIGSSDQYLLSILNSNAITFFYSLLSSTYRGGYLRFIYQYLAQIPIRRIDFATPADERERLVQEIIGAYSIGDNTGVLTRVQAALGANQTDVVHDVLAHLAQTMIDLNKAKQAEVRRFLAWLEKRLWPPHPKSLSHQGRGTSNRAVDALPLPEHREWERGPGGEGNLRLDVPRDLEKRMIEVARVFRKEPTRSEAILWQALRNRQLEGRKFRRQQPIGAFVLDFYCAEERLAVEVDGPIHETQQEADRIRQELIESLGIRFVRLSAEIVENDLASALNMIRAAFLPSPRAVDDSAVLPSPHRGRGAGGEGASIVSLTGKTIIQGYLGDYQKGEDETSWDDFYYRLHQNRNRFAVSLTDVEGEIQREYEASLQTLIPIKHDLARTDALIDKIVYRLYGLTDAEIELIERPGYEQALADAKAQVVADEKIDDEEKIEKIAEGILPAARRFFERVEPYEVEAVLDAELPNWRDLPPDAPVFLVTGDYNLRSLPDHMDFSSSVIPYTKAVEVVLHQRIFEPFRASYRDSDSRNSFLQEFMRGERKLTLGNYMIILSSSKETALRRFMGHSLPDVEGLVTILNDNAMRDVRNKAAHDEVLSRDEARQARTWALGILGMV